jgi:hypothetical protein
MGLIMASEFWNKYYGSLEGARILKFEGMNTEDDLGDGFPEFSVRFANGEVGIISISQDPEGNGGGFIFGLALPADHPQGGEVRSLNA